MNLDPSTCRTPSLKKSLLFGHLLASSILGIQVAATLRASARRRGKNGKNGFSFRYNEGLENDHCQKMHVA